MRWFIVASGPSLIKEDIEKLKGQNVIVINTTYKLAPWATVLYACDPKWWHWNEGAKDFEGEKWTQYSGMGKEGRLKEYIEKNNLEDYKLKYVKSVPNSGISEDPNYIYQGSNSGIQAINLAYHFGAREMVLLGFDMQQTNGKNHWHEDHPDKVNAHWHRWLGLYEVVSNDAKRLGISIINCTRETALKCFEKQDLDIIIGSS